MNGLRRISTLCIAAALLAVAAIVGPAFAESGPGKDGTADVTGDTQSGDNSGPNDHSLAQGDNRPEDPGNKGGSGKGGSDELPAPEKPKRGKHLNASVEHGIVLVRMPGTHRTVVLHDASSLPVGAVVDATHGAVTFVTVPDESGEAQKATFSGSVFQVNQKANGRYTDLKLRGGSFASCSRQGRQAARGSAFGRSFLPLASMTRKRSRRRVRKLWGKGHGHFRTRGRNGAATVRGTVWLTADRCDGTLVRVKRGLVDVRDFAKHKNVSVPAGHSYFARAKKKSKKSHGHAKAARKKQKPKPKRKRR